MVAEADGLFDYMKLITYVYTGLWAYILCDCLGKIDSLLHLY